MYLVVIFNVFMHAIGGDGFKQVIVMYPREHLGMTDFRERERERERETTLEQFLCFQVFRSVYDGF